MPENIPASTSWYLADLGEARGKQELFTKQSPQKLKVLRDHALIESAVSSNRIEGVTVDQARVGTIIFGRSLLRDRDEEEVRGYRDALKLIHEQGAKLSVLEATIKKLHQLTRGDIWDAGKYKDKDADIIEKYPFILKSAYKELEERVGQTVSPKGAKTKLVLNAIRRQSGEFRLADIEHGCPGVGREWIRVLLANLRKTGEVSCRGRGPAARWRHKGRKRSTSK